MRSKARTIKDLRASIEENRIAQENDRLAQENVRVLNETLRIQKQAGTRLGLMRLFSQMTETIASLPEKKGLDFSLADCDFSHRRLIPHRHIPGVIRLAQLTDGAAVLYTTQELHADGFHTLTIPHGSDEPNLLIRFVNVDTRVRGEKIDLTGYDEFAQTELATRALYYGAGALAVEAVTGWEHAITTPQSLGIRLPQEVSPINL